MNQFQLFEHLTEMVVNGVRMIFRRKDETLVISMGHDMSPASTVEAEIDLETAWEMVKELMELIEVGYVEEIEEIEEFDDAPCIACGEPNSGECLTPGCPYKEGN